VVPFLPAELRRLFDGLLLRRVELERPLVERERVVELADLAPGHDGRGVEVLRALLRILDELGQLEDDLDQLGPVLLLGVELHQLREKLAVVRALLERRGQCLLGLAAVGELLELDVPDLEEKIEPLRRDGQLEARPLRPDEVLPFLFLLVDPGQSVERERALRVEVDRLAEIRDRSVERPGAPRGLPAAIERVGALRTAERVLPFLEQLAVGGLRDLGVAKLERDARDPLDHLEIVRRELP
jgi:hypothetical protein